MSVSTPAAYPVDNSERDSHISQIARLAVEGRLGFLFGAGMSIPSGGISGGELAFQLGLNAFYQSRTHDPLPPDFEKELRAALNDFPLEALAEGAIPKLPFGERSLEEIVTEKVFQGNAPTLHDGHTAFGSMVNRFHIETVYTTNWDSLLEEGIGRNAEPITEGKLRDLDGVRKEGRTVVIHLHGTFKDSPLLRERDLMDPERPLLQLFFADLLRDAFVFVGYSAKDPNIRALYGRSQHLLKQRGEKFEKRTYVVYPSRDPTTKRIATAVWEARGATYLDVNASEFFTLLLGEAETHALDGVKTRLRTRLGITADALKAKIDEIMKVFPAFKNPEQVLRYLDAITRGGRP